MPFPQELAAIKSLRNAYPKMGQRTLATKIQKLDFTDPNHKSLAQGVSSRTFASTYSAIRRFDAKTV